MIGLVRNWRGNGQEMNRKWTVIEQEIDKKCTKWTINFKKIEAKY